METIVLAIAIIVVVVWFGLLRPIETAAEAANDELTLFRHQQVRRHSEWYKDNVMTADDMKAADASREYYEKLTRRK